MSPLGFSDDHFPGRHGGKCVGKKNVRKGDHYTYIYLRRARSVTLFLRVQLLGSPKRLKNK